MLVTLFRGSALLAAYPVPPSVSSSARQPMTIAGDGVNLLIRLMCDSPSDCGPGRFGVSYPRKRSLERCKGGPNPVKSALFAGFSHLVTSGGRVPLRVPAAARGVAIGLSRGDPIKEPFDRLLEAKGG